MKKKLSFVLATALVMVSVLVPVSAGATGATPSVMQEVPVVVEVEGAPSGSIVVTPQNTDEEGEHLPETEEIAVALADELAESGVAAEDLVVEYSYHVSMDEEYEGSEVTLTFAAGTVEFSERTYVLVNYGNGWVRVPATRNSDGSISVTVTGSGYIAFFVDTSAVQISYDQTSPQTGNKSTSTLFVFAVVVLVGTGVLVRRRAQ